MDRSTNRHFKILSSGKLPLARMALCRAALVVTPYYNKPSQEGIFQHFKAISESVDIPIVVYNIPGRSIVDIEQGTMERLSKLPTVIGCKDATGDISRVAGLTVRCGEAFIPILRRLNMRRFIMRYWQEIMRQPANGMQSLIGCIRICLSTQAQGPLNMLCHSWAECSPMFGFQLPNAETQPKKS